MNGKNGASSFAIGFLAGAAVGAALGMLYSPQSGEENRNLIRDKTLEARHRAENIIQDARDRAEKIVETARSQASRIRGGKAETPEGESVAE